MLLLLFFKQPKNMIEAKKEIIIILNYMIYFFSQCVCASPSARRIVAVLANLICIFCKFKLALQPYVNMNFKHD